MKKVITSMITIFIVAMLTACGSSETKDTNVSEEQTIADIVGQEVVLESQPDAIVTLVPSLTETVFALGLGDHLVGRSDWCNYPEEALEIPSVGGMEFDVETIIGLNPDIVIAHEMGVNAAEGGFEQLRNAGIPLLIVGNEKNIDDVYRNIKLVGKAIHAEEAADQLVTEMQAKFAEISEKADVITDEERRKVWIEIDPTLITVGKDTFLTEMLEIINADNIAKDEEGWPQYSEEQVLAHNPDVIITTYGYYIDAPKEEIIKRSGWENVNAIKEGRIYDIDNDMVTRAGPRLAKGVEDLAKSIYPEVFAQ